MTLNRFYIYLNSLPVKWRTGGYCGNAIRGVVRGDQHEELCPLVMAAVFAQPMMWRMKPLPRFFEAGQVLGLAEPDVHLVMRAADWCGDQKGMTSAERECRRQLLLACNLTEKDEK